MHDATQNGSGDSLRSDHEPVTCVPADPRFGRTAPSARIMSVKIVAWKLALISQRPDTAQCVSTPISGRVKLLVMKLRNNGSVATQPTVATTSATTKTRSKDI